MAEYPIIMKQKNSSGTYDTLYPKTLGSQVEGMTLDQVSGNLASNRIEGNIPSSQITGLPTSLPANGGNADTVGNQTVQQIIESAVSQGVQVVTGNYVGNGRSGESKKNSLTFSDFIPKFIFISYTSSIGSDTVFATLYDTGGYSYTLLSGIDTFTANNLHVSIIGNEISWYSTGNSNRQMNASQITYQYVAIG